MKLLLWFGIIPIIAIFVVSFLFQKNGVVLINNGTWSLGMGWDFQSWSGGWDGKGILRVLRK